MHIKEIELENFRNYKKEKVGFHEKINIITGDNAQGKTNLLESIYFSSFVRSFRTQNDKEIINFDEDICRVKSTFVKNGEEDTVEIAINKEGRKKARINGKKVERFSEVIGDYYVVVFSPEDLKIVKEEPERRRSFIDRELCQMKVLYFDSLAKYKKTLQQRNTYLKEQEMDEVLLDVWDAKLIEEGTKIIKMRKEFIDELAEISEETHRAITDGSEEPKTKYSANIPYREDEEEQKKEFKEALKESRERDFLHGNTHRGPHKDDLEIKVDGKSTRKFGSQGQQRTAALSLKLAEIELIKKEKGEYPILLLDDVFSELDEKRQRFLVDYLEKMQIFITAAEVPSEILRYFPSNKKIIVKKGRISTSNE